jgi:hypothetical protein
VQATPAAVADCASWINSAITARCVSKGGGRGGKGGGCAAAGRARPACCAACCAARS